MGLRRERSSLPQRLRPKWRKRIPFFLQNAVRLGEGSSAVSERIVLSCNVRKKEWLDGAGVAERYICGATEANNAGGSTTEAVGIV